MKSHRLPFLGPIFVLTIAGALGWNLPARASIVVVPQQFTVTEGQAGTVSLASLIDTNQNDPASSFAVQVNWGDGSTSPGTVSGSNGTFTISGQHTYADEGSFGIAFVVNNTNFGGGQGVVAEGDQLTGSFLPIAVTAGQQFSGSVASFSDTLIGNVAGDFSATINWGDGVTDTAVVTQSLGMFDVSSAHIYQDAGQFPVVVNLSESSEDGGSASATVTGTASVGSTVPEPGSILLVGAGIGALLLRMRRRAS